MAKMVSSFMKFLTAEIYIVPLVVTGVFYNVYLSLSIPLLSTGIVKQMPNPIFVMLPAFVILLYVIHRIKTKFLLSANPGEMVWKVRNGKVVEVSRKYVWRFDDESEFYGVFPIIEGSKIVVSGTIPYTVAETQLIIPYRVTLPFKHGANRYQEIFEVFKQTADDGKINIEAVVRGFVEHHAESRLFHLGNDERRDIKRVLEEVLAVPDRFKEMVCFSECRLQYKNPDQGLILEFTPGLESGSPGFDQPEGESRESEQDQGQDVDQHHEQEHGQDVAQHHEQDRDQDVAQDREQELEKDPEKEVEDGQKTEAPDHGQRDP
jgi:hypothetical protein